MGCNAIGRARKTSVVKLACVGARQAITSSASLSLKQRGYKNNSSVFDFLLDKGKINPYGFQPFVPSNPIRSRLLATSEPLSYHNCGLVPFFTEHAPIMVPRKYLFPHVIEMN